MVNQNKTTFIVPHQVDHVAFSRGGGLSIFFKRNANNINIFIENCTFYDNSAQWGGGVFVEFHDDTHNNSVYLSYSWFYLNFCFYQETGHENSGLAGGGARLGFVIIGENSIQNNLIEVISCNFTNNICMNGGGASFYTTKEISPVSTNKMIFRNCTWEKNYGMFGSAVNLHLWQGSDIGVLSTVEFENGTFQENIMGLIGTFSNQQGFGALYVDHIHIRIDAWKERGGVDVITIMLGSIIDKTNSKPPISWISIIILWSNETTRIIHCKGLSYVFCICCSSSYFSSIIFKMNTCTFQHLQIGIAA